MLYYIVEFKLKDDVPPVVEKGTYDNQENDAGWVPIALYLKDDVAVT